MSENEVKKLRREVEILKAQLAGKKQKKKQKKAAESGKESKKKGPEPQEEKNQNPEIMGKHVRSDLHRSLIITGVILTIIITLYFTQPYWPLLS